MKYMGSKRVMLTNGLGHSLDESIAGASRFVDLFLGTGEVASFVARRHHVPVFGVDLQSYSVVLAEAIITRNRAFDWQPVWASWLFSAKQFASHYEVPIVDQRKSLTRKVVEAIRGWCSGQQDLPLTQAYGGHYLSAAQAVLVDAFRQTLPADEPARTVCLASLIRATSQCVASPGHTAQPFQPTRTAARFLKTSWLMDPTPRISGWLKQISAQHAFVPGAARICDANEVAEHLTSKDLVFLDPPYSGVHYSRFYHVLETLSRGHCGEVTGIGRYPDPAKRPRSRYSVVTESEDALNQLLFLVSACGARAILTFPDHECSNGLSGNSVRAIAKAHFKVREYSVQSKFSTLGGRGTGQDKVAKRKARHEASELLLVLTPR